jgi:pimeloyl-ACP methyl ester carboxylesterase
LKNDDTMMAASGKLAHQKRFASFALPLPPALAAERREIDGRSGRLSYYVAGKGPPLLLIHSINASASAFEVRPIFEAMRDRRRVYAVDLPGFGFSDRADRDYNVRLYVDAVQDMLDAIAADCGFDPIDALALSLGAEFLARAAVQAPQRLRRLIFVAPTGLSRLPAVADPGSGAQGTREIAGLLWALQVPLWRQKLFDLLVSRTSIRYFLGRAWGSKHIDEALFRYCFLTAHQPGACNAPYAFVSGRLFSKDVVRVYAALKMPVLVCRGTKGEFQDLRGLDQMSASPNWSVQTFDSGAMPHFERAIEFNAALTRFFQTPAP